MMTSPSIAQSKLASATTRSRIHIMSYLWTREYGRAIGLLSLSRPYFIIPDCNPTSPVALRPTQSSLVYAALILHALYFVPQVRIKVAEFRVDSDDMTDGEGGMSGTSVFLH